MLCSITCLWNLKEMIKSVSRSRAEQSGAGGRELRAGS